MVVRRWDGMVHGFLEMAPVVKRAHEGLLEIARWLEWAFREQGTKEPGEVSLPGLAEKTPADAVVSSASLQEDAARGDVGPALATEVTEAPGRMPRPPLEQGQVLRVGMEVVGSDGQRMGKVKAVRANDFVVDRRFRRAVALPFEAVHEAGDRVILSVPAKEATKMDWSPPSL
jgi:sporulation protein YlmC with PRC-barrel domain